MSIALGLVVGCGRIDFDRRSDGGVDASGGVRKSPRLDRVDPGEPLLDFPLLVVLDDSRIDRTQLKPDTSDLRFFDSSGNLVPHELEQLGASGGLPLLVWVRMPRIEGLTTTLDLTYGHSSGSGTSTASSMRRESRTLRARRGGSPIRWPRCATK